MAALGAAPKLASCAQRKEAMSPAPSLSSVDSVHRKKGASGSVVPGSADHAARQAAMSAGMRHA